MPLQVPFIRHPDRTVVLSDRILQRCHEYRPVAEHPPLEPEEELSSTGSPDKISIRPYRMPVRYRRLYPTLLE